MRTPSYLPSLVGRTEAFFLRAGLVAIVLWSIWTPSKYDSVPEPVGLASWHVPVAWIGQDGVHPWFLAGTMLAGLLYVLSLWRPGWLTFVSLLGLTAAHVGYWTLANSQRNTFHGSQMTSLVLVAQLVAYGIMAVRLRRGIPPSSRWPGLDSALLYFSQCAIAGVYVVCALTKIFKSKGRWLLDSHYFAKSVQKVWRQLYFDNPSSGDYAGVSPWASWMLEHPMLSRLLFAPGFFLELFAFLLIWNRAWAAGWGIALILMHFGISVIMQLEFPEFQMLVLVFCVNAPFWLLRMRGRPAA